MSRTVIGTCPFSTAPGNSAFIRRARVLMAVLSLCIASHAAVARETPAFPGAEGFGRLASGGRGGDVYVVSNLNDSGPGSLREGIRSAHGPRTIIFSVSGTIELKSRLVMNKSSITIAGQTAPGDGITIRDMTFQIRSARNIIIRYIRFRLGDENKGIGAEGGDDTLNTEWIDNVIFDHCSLSWAIDGTHDMRYGANFTMQWSIISESLNHSLHEKGTHAMGASYRSPVGNISLHHNIYTTCRDRHPSLGSLDYPPQYVIDFRNNLIYNWSDPGTCNFCDAFINCINNEWRPGPMTNVRKLPIAMKGSLPDLAKGHMEGNIFEERPDLTQDNYAALDFHRWLGHSHTEYKYKGTVKDWKTEQAPDLGANTPKTESAREAAELDLKYSGDSLHRDAVDERLVKNIRTHQGRVIDSEHEVGGWPELKSLPAPVDSDGDGIPDDWEKAHGLNPNDASDGAKLAADGSGYSNLEEYINSLCPH